MRTPQAILLANKVSWVDGDAFDYVYGDERLSRIATLTRLYPIRLSSLNFAQHQSALGEVEVIFSCWGMPALNSEQLNALPALKAVFYASGSVKAFAGPLLERGIVVCSAAEANAIPVAEFCLAQILLSCKAAFRNSSRCRLGPWVETAMPSGTGAYGATVALIAIGAVTRYLLKLLQPFNLRVIAVSDYLTEKEANAMGIAKLVDIETAFREGDIVSNHLPDLPELYKCFKQEHFASMREGATFINTGRGKQVDELGMIAALQARPDLTALLDVQHPEPPAAGSPLYTLPNVHMTSHIAGSKNNEVRRMADMMIEDFLAWRDGHPLRRAVRAEEFKKSA
jgi:phosphoglycerate dehydrogenase-like enzyme